MTLISRYFSCAAAALILSGLSASAATFSFSGVGGGPIMDSNTPANPVVMTFNVSGLDGPLTGITLDMGISHTYVGDLIFTLERPDLTTFTIMHRPGRPVGGPGAGDSSNLGGPGTYTFSDAGVALLPVAAALGTADNIPNASYRTAGEDDLPTVFNSFVSGLSAAAATGTWTLRVSDNASSDSGNLSSGTLNLTTDTTPVPEPGSAMLNLVLGSMGIALTARRRR